MVSSIVNSSSRSLLGMGDQLDPADLEAFHALQTLRDTCKPIRQHLDPVRLHEQIPITVSSLQVHDMANTQYSPQAGPSPATP